MNILEIKNLRKKFKDVQALDGIEISIEKGDIHGILGPNGAGKSTTMNCILGLIKPESGEIKFEGGYDLKAWKQNIGYVPQDLALYEELSAEENVSFFCSLYKLKNIREKVDNALKFVGLSDVRKKKVSEFSGGMKRRLNLACGIVHEPKLIIMDEPTVGIDPQSRNKIMENVKKLNESGATIIYTTHYMPEVEEICNKITIVDHGKVITSGTKHDIQAKLGNDSITTITFAEGESVEAFAARIKSYDFVASVRSEKNEVAVRYNSDSNFIEVLIKEAVSAGLTIKNIKTEEPSLEDIFLILTGKELRDSV